MPADAQPTPSDEPNNSKDHIDTVVRVLEKFGDAKQAMRGYVHEMREGGHDPYFIGVAAICAAYELLSTEDDVGPRQFRQLVDSVLANS